MKHQRSKRSMVQVLLVAALLLSAPSLHAQLQFSDHPLALALLEADEPTQDGGAPAVEGQPKEGPCTPRNGADWQPKAALSGK